MIRRKTKTSLTVPQTKAEQEIAICGLTDHFDFNCHINFYFKVIIYLQERWPFHNGSPVQCFLFERTRRWAGWWGWLVIALLEDARRP